MKEALEPKKPGRKLTAEEQQRITELSRKQSSLEQEVEHWKSRYEVAQDYIDVVHAEEARMERNRRKRERKGQKKKPRSAEAKSSRATASQAGSPRLAVIDGGEGAGDTDGEPEAVEEQTGKADE